VGRGAVEKIIRERVQLKEEALKEALNFSLCASRKLGRICSILFGSYARGDFNEWSDIDVLIIAERVSANPIERLGYVHECLKETPRVEPVIISLDEFRKLRKKNPAVLDALNNGIVLLDQLGLSAHIRRETWSKA
jgi:predicted nucleotidyltransferase